MYTCNMVAEGIFKGKKIAGLIGDVYIVVKKVGLFDSKRLYLNYETVKDYEMINRTNYVSEHIYGRTYGNTISGTVTKDVYSEVTVLITFKDGNQSLIVIDGFKYSRLKESCKYNLNFDKYMNSSEITNKFDMKKEVVCPHCDQIVYGNPNYCPRCKKLINKPPKFKLLHRWQKRLIALVYFIIMVAVWDKPFMAATWGVLMLSGIIIFYMIYLIVYLIIKLINEKRQEKLEDERVFGKKDVINNSANFKLEETSEKRWGTSEILSLITLIFFSPLGLFIMWATKAYSKRTRIIITGIICILLFIVFYNY